MGHYIKVSELPPSVQKGLEAVGYGRKDIEVSVRETFEPSPISADGRRGFLVACRLDDSNECRVTWGSYGGSNMFTKSIDDVDGSFDVPKDVAFLSGMSGAGEGYPAYAYLVISPKNMNPTLLPPVASVTKREAKILAIFRYLRSSARKEYLNRMRASGAEVDSLVARGFLSRNKAGAMSITTEGRNAAGRDYY